MISLDELRIKQVEFEGARPEFKKELEKLESERKTFLKKFPKESLNQLTLEKYVTGNKSKSSFCYWLENRLKGLGNIHGASASKFGIYFGKTKSDPTLKYRFTSKFGSNEIEAFENIKKAIVNLLDLVEKGDIKGIKENPLSPMFKGKILCTYYPKKFLNIFANRSEEHTSELQSH